jgi:hypothetical protein
VEENSELQPGREGELCEDGCCIWVTSKLYNALRSGGTRQSKEDIVKLQMGECISLRKCVVHKGLSTSYSAAHWGSEKESLELHMGERPDGSCIFLVSKLCDAVSWGDKVAA